MDKYWAQWRASVMPAEQPEAVDMDDFWAQRRATVARWRSLGADTRTANCLTNYEITTLEKLADTSDEYLMNLANFGKASLKCVYAILRENGYPRDTHPVPTSVVLRRLELNSLLLAYESAVLALYDLQREDLGPDDFPGIDRDGSIAKRKITIENTRQRILSFVLEA